MDDLIKNLKPTFNQAESADLDIFLPRELSDKERDILFEKFWQTVNTGSPKPNEVFAILYSYFSDSGFNAPIIEKYYDTFWSIFVKIGWRILTELKMDYEAEFVARTIFNAVAEYIDVKTKFTELLILYSAEDASLLCKKIKQKLLFLDYPLSFNEYGKKIIISQLVKKISLSEQEKDLSRFTMFAEIQKALFMDIADENEAAKKVAALRTKELIELMYFFTKDYDASVLIDEYFNKINKQTGLKIDADVKAEIGASVLYDYFFKEMADKSLKKIENNNPISNQKFFLEELPKHKQDFVVWIAEASTLRGLLDWMKTFETGDKGREVLQSILEKTLGAESLNNIDMAMAVAGLNEFLIKNNYFGDDLIHFDERSEKFKWGK